MKWNLVFFINTLPKLIMINYLSSKSLESDRIIEGVREQYHITPQRLFTISETKKNPNTIRLQDLVVDLQENKKIIPKYHVYSRFHYQLLYPRFQQFLSYPDYCLLEERLSDVLRSYLIDSKPSLFVMEDPYWFYDDSLISYFTLEEKKSVERNLIVDLDVAPSLQILPNAEKQFFLWTTNSHPYL